VLLFGPEKPRGGMADNSVQTKCPISQLLEKLGETVIDPVIVDYLNSILNGSNFTDNCDENAVRVELRCVLKSYEEPRT
jgi:hypothetical protein